MVDAYHIHMPVLQSARLAWLLAVAILPLLWFAWRHRLSRSSAARSWIALATRLLLVTLVILALAGLTFQGSTNRQAVVVAVDRSLSTAGTRDAAATFCRELTRTAGNNRLAFLAFATTPAVATPDWRDEVARLDPLESDPGAAVIAAGKLLPADYVPQIVLLTDGNQTRGDLHAAAAQVGVPISVVPLDSLANPEVYVESMAYPTQVRQHEAIAFDVALYSNHADHGKLVLQCGSETLVRQTVDVARGENSFRFSQPALMPGRTTYAVRIEGFRDTIPENNRASATVVVGPPSRALLVEGQPDAGGRLAAVLRQAKLEVDCRPPQNAPTRSDELRRYDAILLVNVPATLLSPAASDGICRYVKAGGGLLVVGGDQAFTPGGYAGTTLEQILPVTSIRREKTHKPELAMVLVIDRSESMGGRRIELAKAAMRRAVEMLGTDDQVGVIAFEDESYWACPLKRCSDKRQVLAQIASIQAEGRTNLAPAMEKAYLALHEADADLKHIVILTDGLSHTADFAAVARRIAADRITLSTLGIGGEVAGPVLEQLARIGRGHYYYLADATSLPTIFALETAAASKQGVVEEPFVAQPQAATAGSTKSALPALLGYDLAQAKPASHVVLSTPSGDPVLAHWQCGQGKVAAFMSDAGNRWAAAWLRWPGFDPFWGDAIRGVLPALPPAQIERHAPADYPEEMRLRPTNVGLLREVARMSGGRYDPGAASIFAPSGRTVPLARPLGAWLLAAALAVFMLDVAIKRSS
jgi:uncharacterized membrane protein